MKEFLWRIIAQFVVKHRYAIIRRAMKTPYTHIGVNGEYMERYWLFNAYTKDANDNYVMGFWSKFGLPAMRVHWIRRPDGDRHCHSHPWDARSIIMVRGYVEFVPAWVKGKWAEVAHVRYEGQMNVLSPSIYHRITRVPPEGVWTLFLTWKPQDDWYFLVDGKPISNKIYLKKNDV